MNNFWIEKTKFEEIDLNHCIKGFEKIKQRKVGKTERS